MLYIVKCIGARMQRLAVVDLRLQYACYLSTRRINSQIHIITILFITNYYMYICV